MVIFFHCRYRYFQGPLNGGVSNGVVSRSGLVLPFLSFFVLFGTFPIFLGFSRFARGRSGIFPICPFPLSQPIQSTYNEQSWKGPRHNLDLSQKKVGNARIWNPPGLASLNTYRELRNIVLNYFRYEFGQTVDPEFLALSDFQPYHGQRNRHSPQIILEELIMDYNYSFARAQNYLMLEVPGGIHRELIHRRDRRYNFELWRKCNNFIADGIYNLRCLESRDSNHGLRDSSVFGLAVRIVGFEIAANQGRFESLRTADHDWRPLSL